MSPNERLRFIDDMVREMSLQSDPQDMVQVFRRRAVTLYEGVGSISLSRRGLQAPWYRITRSTAWKEEIDPWREPHRLPMYSRGILGELLYADRPQTISNVRIPPDDPAYDLLRDARSMLSLPMYDGGAAINMVVNHATAPNFFDEDETGDALLRANLFGRATHSLLLSRQLRDAYAALDRELRIVGAMQRSLLPALPMIPTLDLAASYKTAARAGGDYYDVFPLHDGLWGALIADVSGHGTPAAVVMAILRTLFHTGGYNRSDPRESLSFVNEQLMRQLPDQQGTFVTAFYGVYDSNHRSLTFSSAGHNPPLHVHRDLAVSELDSAQALPLGVDKSVEFVSQCMHVKEGDTLILYTDGITEASDPGGEQYGRERLLTCVREDVRFAQEIVDCVVGKLERFTAGSPPQDDQTVLAMRVR